MNQLNRIILISLVQVVFFIELYLSGNTHFIDTQGTAGRPPVLQALFCFFY